MGLLTVQGRRIANIPGICNFLMLSEAKWYLEIFLVEFLGISLLVKFLVLVLKIFYV